jgi:hypothetical protein
VILHYFCLLLKEAVVTVSPEGCDKITKIDGILFNIATRFTGLTTPVSIDAFSLLEILHPAKAAAGGRKKLSIRRRG